jgi:N-acetylneuraminate synthase
LDSLVKNIWEKVINPDRTFIIAEAGVNHNGSLELAEALVDEAASAGADAVKFQTFSAERLAHASACKVSYQLQTREDTESQVDMLRRLELSESAHYSLIDHCRDKGICFLSSPFDEISADFLDDLGIPLFKVPSGELTNLPFLSHLASKRRPMIISTGMANLSDVEHVVNLLKDSCHNSFALLHCVSNYPVRPVNVNLRAMQTLAEVFKAPVGYSDHTQGFEVALAAVAMGACIIEKHFTLDRNQKGPDHKASLDPFGLRHFIEKIRIVESSLGNGDKIPSISEEMVARAVKKSLFASKDIEAGTTLSKEMITALRPGTGLSPSFLPQIIGRSARIRIAAGSMLDLEMFE